MTPAIATPDLSAYWTFTPNRQFKAAPRMAVSTEGVAYRTPDGREVLDGNSGLWCAGACHCHPRVAAAMKAWPARNRWAWRKLLASCFTPQRHLSSAGLLVCARAGTGERSFRLQPLRSRVLADELTECSQETRETMHKTYKSSS